jgi:hypothetical protein
VDRHLLTRVAMTMTHSQRLFGPFVGLLIASASFAGCSGSVVGEEIGDDDAALTNVDGELAVGTRLVTTTRVNFRRGPSLGSAIIRILERGAPVTLLDPTPNGAFYNVKSGTEQGWAHGAYLARESTTPGGGENPGGGNCQQRQLRFSADDFPSLPAAGSAYVWGGNATEGESQPYSSTFISYAQRARSRGLKVFAYLEGPCGDTDGVDDGERARCSRIHNNFNATHAPNTPNTATQRWKPFTFEQFKRASQVGVDYCEIDNLSNNVTIPLNPLLRELKALYDSGQTRCRVVLKNVEADAIDSIRANVAPTPAAANFIAPFHIYEADDTSQKSALDAAMARLKGPGAKTIISTDTNRYGSAFTNDRFLACD